MPDLPAPLILTLALDEAAQTYFNALRRQHFPPGINYLAAHLTLFHHLPGASLAEVSQLLQAQARTQHPLALQVAGLRSLGRGVAFTIENEELRALHRTLQTTFAPSTSRPRTSRSCSRTSPFKTRWLLPKPGSCWPACRPTLLRLGPWARGCTCGPTGAAPGRAWPGFPSGAEPAGRPQHTGHRSGGLQRHSASGFSPTCSATKSCSSSATISSAS